MGTITILHTSIKSIYPRIDIHQEPYLAILTVDNGIYHTNRIHIITDKDITIVEK